jgi:CelD/BcsL family acetyltransferase involved in cellulose biosynthesis
VRETVGDVEVLDPAVAGEDIRCAWRRLAIGRENPFLTPEWFEAWHDPAAERPWVLLWRRRPGGEVDAVLPLVLADDGMTRSLRFPGGDNGDWFGIACDTEDEPDAIGACLAAVRSRASEWDLLRLDRIEDQGAWSGAGGGRPGLRAFRPPDVLPFLIFGEGGYEGWLSSRSRNFRSQLGRRRRRAQREHEAVFRDTPEQADLGAALEGLFELHEARRLMQGGEGVLDRRAREAYGRFAELSLERGWLRMHSLELDREPVAFWHGWRVGGRYCYGISGFDPRWEDLAVGTLLLVHTIERAAIEGAEVYDLLWGEEAYKERYATGRREVVSLAAAAGLRGRISLAGRRGLSRVSHSLPDGARQRLRALRARGGRR